MSQYGLGQQLNRPDGTRVPTVLLLTLCALLAGVIVMVATNDSDVVAAQSNRAADGLVAPSQVLSDPAYVASLRADEVLGASAQAEEAAARPAPELGIAAPGAPVPAPPAAVPGTPVPATPVPAPPVGLPATAVPGTPVRVPSTSVPAPPPPPTATVTIPVPELAPAEVSVPSVTRAGPPGVVNQLPGSVWRWLNAHGWTVDWRQGPGPGRLSEAQYSTSTIVIWYDTARSDTIWAGAFAHELGHAVSYVHLGQQQMNQWNSMRGLSSWRWVPGTPNDFTVGEGDFAEAFMSHLLGHRVRSVGGPLTQEHRAWISANTPF